MDAQKTHFADDETLKHIDRLQTINAELVAALEVIAKPITGSPIGNAWDFYADLQNVARAALSKAKGE